MHTCHAKISVYICYHVHDAYHCSSYGYVRCYPPLLQHQYYPQNGAPDRWPGRAWYGGRRDEAPARLAQLPLRLDARHEAVRGAGGQRAQRQLPVLRHQRAGQLALKDARCLRRLKRLALQPSTAFIVTELTMTSG